MIDLSDSAVSRRTGDLVSPTARSDERVDLDARMMWSALTEPGDSVAGALVATHGARVALELVLGGQTSRHIVEATGVGERTAREATQRWQARLSDVVHAAPAARRAGVAVITPDHPAWPRTLDDLGPFAPHCLWVRGAPMSLTHGVAAVSLVGARASTSYGEDVATNLAAEIAIDGVAVISGGAYGIDGAAHRSALRVGGITVAWLAGGVDRAYPSGHRGLLQDITANRGAVVSEVPCGSAPTKWRFLARNRLIAASSAATVVVEAGWRSGSINTAGHAAALGRPVGAVPGPITSAASAGCHRLLREYGAVCITASADVRELMGFDADLTQDSETGGSYLDDRIRVRDALSSRTARPSTDLARRSGLDLAATEAALGLLALDGHARRTDDGWRAGPS